MAAIARDVQSRNFTVNSPGIYQQITFSSRLPRQSEINLPPMEKLRRTRMVVATSEKLTVWHVSSKTSEKVDSEKVSVECPHCGEEVFRVELERSETPEIKLIQEGGTVCTDLKNH
jgi:predicted RNA-binding Zn-ribbon protein involved in translation (DUF1610 family)